MFYQGLCKSSHCPLIPFSVAIFKSLSEENLVLEKHFFNFGKVKVTGCHICAVWRITPDFSLAFLHRLLCFSSSMLLTWASITQNIWTDFLLIRIKPLLSPPRETTFLNVLSYQLLWLVCELTIPARKIVLTELAQSYSTVIKNVPYTIIFFQAFWLQTFFWTRNGVRDNYMLCCMWKNSNVWEVIGWTCVNIFSVYLAIETV